MAEEMRAALRDMQEERSRFEALVEGSRFAMDRLKQLAEPIDKAGSDLDLVTLRLDQVQQRLEAMGQLSVQLRTLDERADVMAEEQRRADTEIADVLKEAQQIRGSMAEVSQKVDLAIDLKDRLVSFLDIEKPFQVLRGDADALRGVVDGTVDQLARMREQHDRHLDAHNLAMSKMEALDRRREELSRDLQDKERRVATVEQAIRGMDGVQQTVDDARREIGTLKALTDFVAQKSAALEAQREAVDDALARADQLDRVMRQIDAGVRQQQTNEKTLGEMHDQVSALQSLHETVVERAREIAQLQRDAEAQGHTTQQDLSVVRDEMKATVERFDFESRGLESVSQRVADLRSALSDFENRFKSLNESSQHVAELKSETQSLNTQLAALNSEYGQLDDELATMQAMRRDLDETMRTAREVGAQVARIDLVRPAVESALRDVQQLSGAHAMVQDALEQTQLAHGEVVRMRESQTETRAWLDEVEGFVDALKEQVSELRSMSPTIDSVQKQAQRVSESMSAIETQRGVVDDLERRMTDLGSLSGNLDERGRQLHTRMESAEFRFAGLAAQAEEAERMTKELGAIKSGLKNAVRDSEAVAKTVAATEARCESVEELAERTRALRQEIEQRQSALAAATKDIQQASELRSEAAASAQQLDELAKRLANALTAADRRVEQVDALSTELEGRATGLQVVEKRLVQFEERLTKWERVEHEIARSLEQIVARQGTVEALQGDLDRMFAMAEKTATDVREITSAHREIEESRGLLRDVMGRLREVHDTSSAIEERKRQMSKAEERLARADALLIDVRTSIEALQGQKAIVDQAVEKSGSLRFLLKQAEAMIEGLRDERRMTADVHAAIDIVRREDDDDEDEDMAQAA